MSWFEHLFKINCFFDNAPILVSHRKSRASRREALNQDSRQGGWLVVIKDQDCFAHTCSWGWVYLQTMMVEDDTLSSLRYFLDFTHFLGRSFER